MELLLLLVASLLPGLILLYYIFYMDRNEKEPIGLIIKSVSLGALSTLLAIAVEVAFESLHPIFTDGNKTLTSAFVKSFIQIAPIEEFSKLIVVLLFIWKQADFNEENDGIVYVSASAIGFAMFENIFYVLEGGLSIGILRSVTAMPLHCFTGVIMGYYVGLAKFSLSYQETKKKILLGFVLAVVIHGLYDSFAMSGTNLALLLLPTVILLIVVGIKTLKKGRELSLSRWGLHSEEAGLNINHTREPETNGEVSISKWKIWISRPIFILCFSFWVLLFIGSGKHEVYELIMGGIILTVIPLSLVFLLEFSYYQNKKRIPENVRL